MLDSHPPDISYSFLDINLADKKTPELKAMRERLLDWRDHAGDGGLINEYAPLLDREIDSRQDK